MPLPGFEDLNRETVRKRIDYERRTPEAIGDLLPLLASANREGPQGFAARKITTDAPFALQWAAELAFAIEEVGLGLQICSEIVDLLRPAPPTPMQWALWTTAGALTGEVYTVLTQHGALASWSTRGPDYALQRILRLGDSPHRRNVAELPWPDSGAASVAIGRKLIPAVVASLGERGFQPLDTEYRTDRLGAAAGAALFETDEYRVAALATGSDMFADDREGALRAMEHRYLQRLARVRSSPQWERLAYPVPLIDWTLTALYVAAVRSDRGYVGEKIAPGSPAAFLWKLALAIARAPKPALGY